MAGYVINSNSEPGLSFHIDSSNLDKNIRWAADGKRVVTLQLDGDELDAALWGLENYRKNEVELKENELTVSRGTILTFRNETKKYQHFIKEVISNISVGQVFVYEHKDIKQCHAGRITNIQHHIFPDGSSLTYIDVAVN